MREVLLEEDANGEREDTAKGAGIEDGAGGMEVGGGVGVGSTLT